jgi:IS5 family transposase
MQYKQTTSNSFFGDFLYDKVVPHNHFLRKLKHEIPWSRFNKQLDSYYEQGGLDGGRPPYEPVMLLKMLLLSYLYNISERQVEEFVDLQLAAKYFVGLGVDEKAPDNSSLSVFKRRMLEKSGQQGFEALFEEILAIALEKGITFGSIQTVDSVHTIANVNTQKDKQRKRKVDPDAMTGCKGTKTVQDSTGNSMSVPLWFDGYKSHTSMNAKNHLITSIITTPGNAYDGHFLRDLLDEDRQKGIPVKGVTADKGYDNGDNHFYLMRNCIDDGIILNRYRTEKKDENKEIWLRMKAEAVYKTTKKERYKIERKFGEEKQGHGFGRCRYYGLARYTIQSLFTAMVVNLKRMIKLLTGVGFRTKTIAVAT